MPAVIGSCRRERNRLRALGAAILSLLAAPALAQAPDPRPNIVFILADDLGWGDVGAYGQTVIRTPSIDRMAAEGVRFTDAYGGAPICMPSRLSLLTGRHTGNLRVNTNAGEAGALAPADLTLAEVLKAAGYATGMIGKWGVGSKPGASLPPDQGFDAWFGYPDDMTAHEHFPPYLWRNGEREFYPQNAGAMRGQYSNDLFADEAVAFIRANKARRFFLYLPFTIPHARFQVPKDSLAEYAGKVPETPWLGEDGGTAYAPYYPDPVLKPNATRAAMITRLDGHVGRVLAELAAQGLDGNTLVVFTSDNGPEAITGADIAYFRSTGPFRGVKMDLNEGGIRAPLIVRWPGMVRAGRVEATPVAFWDFMPTFAEIAGAPGGPTDGVSIAPLLRGRGRLPDRDLYWEFGRTVDGRPSLRQAIRRGDLKALRLSRERPLQLYDLSKDPGETTDIAERHPRQARRFRAVMDAAAKKRLGGL